MNTQKKLSDLNMSRQEECMILSEITRAEMAVSYWESHLRQLNEMPDIMRGEVKHMYNRCMRFIGMFRKDIREMLPTQQGYDMLLDAACELQRYGQKQLYFYEQAIKRAVDREKFKYSDFMSRMAVSKDLLEIATYCLGLEAKEYPRIVAMTRIGGFTRANSFFGKKYINDKEVPSTMGFLCHMSATMNTTILKALGYNDIIIEMTTDDEVGRAMEISGVNIAKTMMDHAVISAMYEDQGHTLDEAKAIVKQREEAYKAEQAKQAEKAKLKEAKKNSKINNPKK